VAAEEEEAEGATAEAAGAEVVVVVAAVYLPLRTAKDCSCDLRPTLRSGPQ